MKTLAGIAQANDLPMVVTEGGKHTKVVIGTRTTFVPRHREISELTARAIVKQATPEEEE
jgi:mRNA interferase HicA